MLVTGLAFGGGYATLLALPFLFAAFSLVAAYLSNPSHDKGFVRIGLALAGGFFFAPLASLLFIAVVSFRFVWSLTLGIDVLHMDFISLLQWL